jgi:hypothetical protein
MSDRLKEKASEGIKLIMKDPDEFADFLAEIIISMAQMENRLQMLEKLSYEKDLPKR